MKKAYLIIGGILFIVLLAGGIIFIYKNTKKEIPKTQEIAKTPSTTSTTSATATPTGYEKFLKTRFGGGGSESENFEAMVELGVHFKRIAQGISSLGVKQSFAWDEQIKAAQEKEIWMMGIVDPVKTQRWPTTEEFTVEFKKIVERYDGDGIEDMEGLKYPIKYYELGNEIELGQKSADYDGPGPERWQGFSLENYLDLYQSSWKILKETCPDCQLSPGSFVGGQPSNAFQYLAKEAKEKIDFISYHSYQEYLDVDDLMTSLSDLGLAEKPIFLTESQFGGMQKQESFSQDELAKIQTRSYVFALAKGIDKLMPAELEAVSKFPAGLKWSCLIGEDGTKRPSFYAYQTLIKKLDFFTDVKEIAKYQYQFIVEGKPIYVLWGDGSIDSYFNNLKLKQGSKIVVTDISGQEKEYLNFGQIKITDNPIFVEIK